MSDPQPDRRFSDDDFSVILRKAAEMQEASGAPQHAEGLTLAEIEHIAREAGIDPRYVRRAANSLTATPPSEWGARLLGGPRRFHLADEVPGRIPDQGWKKLVEEVRRDFAKDDKVAHLPGSLEWKGKSGTGLELDMWVTSDDEGTRLSLRGDAEEEMMVWHLLGPMGGVLASILIIGGLDAAGVEAVLLGLGGRDRRVRFRAGDVAPARGAVAAATRRPDGAPHPHRRRCSRAPRCRAAARQPALTTHLLLAVPSLRPDGLIADNRQSKIQSPRMQDFEKLGAFYLGKTYDLRAGETRDELVLYDSRDLTTHAVIIGMTGSGKTGLGLGMLEEAAIDGIPVIAIDPKGDLGNLLLNFPELAAEEFEPWVNPQEAATGGATVAEFAEQQAGLWKQGLANWGQDGERVRRLRDAAEMAVYTPGSSAGIPVSVLRSFRAPPAELRADMDLFRERIAGTATGILALMGMEGDPLTSREHILIANLLEHAWTAGRDLDVPGLIAAIQQPPMERVGVLDVDTFYPPKERFGLAMKLNNLLAAPGFEAWMEGEPLDVGSFLYDSSGKPRISIFSIAHLSESERMFFVSMLLNEMVAWVRTQSGTTSLRAILYMDEVFGYLPPTANPPSKTPMLTLLKQARAYGLGVVLSTQNPVDLDYKALSNTGTWFIGRLQTERDKMRVLEGLEGAAAGGDFDKNRMEQILAGLGKRVFLLHNVHEDQPTVFHTRWALSYLAGPLTRQQIGTLMADRRPAHASAPSSPAPVATEAATSGGWRCGRCSPAGAADRAGGGDAILFTR